MNTTTAPATVNRTLTPNTLVRVTTPQGRQIVGRVVRQIRTNKVELDCSGTSVIVTVAEWIGSLKVEYVPVGTRQGWQ